MNNPGSFALGVSAITAVVTQQTLTQGLNGNAYRDGVEGALAATFIAKFAYGSGGTTAKAIIETTHDDGQTWIPIATFAFAQASLTKHLTVSGLTPKLAAVTLGADPADDVAIDGVLGTRFRCRLTTVGVYVNTSIAVYAVFR